MLENVQIVTNRPGARFIKVAIINSASCTQFALNLELAINRSLRLIATLSEKRPRSPLMSHAEIILQITKLVLNTVGSYVNVSFQDPNDVLQMCHTTFNPTSESI